MPTPPSFDLETITDKSEEWSPQTLNAPAKISPFPPTPDIFYFIPLFSALNSGGILNVPFSMSPPKTQVSLGMSYVSMIDCEFTIHFHMSIFYTLFVLLFYSPYHHLI